MHISLRSSGNFHACIFLDETYASLCRPPHSAPALFPFLACAHSLGSNMSRCPFCLAVHGCAPGDIGGTAYADAAYSEEKLIGKLCKHTRVRAGALEARLRVNLSNQHVLPGDLQWLATVLCTRFPKGIFLIHEELQACCLFRAAQIPRLVGFICGLRLMSSGLAVGFALLRKRRMGWLGVTHKALKS